MKRTGRKDTTHHFIETLSYLYILKIVRMQIYYISTLGYQYYIVSQKVRLSEGP